MHETVLASSLLSILQDTVARYIHAQDDTRDGLSSHGGHTLHDKRGKCHKTDDAFSENQDDAPDPGETYGAETSRSPRSLHIEEVVVTVGVLSCVEPQTLRGCFEIMAEGTVAHKALLTIVTRPMKGRCPDCGQTVETVERRFSCPLCNGTQVDWQDGRGMEITSIRVVGDEREKMEKTSKNPPETPLERRT